jgi:hypothetical protein
VRGNRTRLLAVGAAVVAELVLGAFLVATGGGSPANPNPYRVGEGFLVPPPCSMIDRGPVSGVLGTDDFRLTESAQVVGDDPARGCAFKADRAELGAVTVGMGTALVGAQGWPDIHAIGISEFMPSDNLARDEPKRTYDFARVSFEIDNLQVSISYEHPARVQPPPTEAGRVRSNVMELTKQIAGKLIPRNKTGPTLPSIVPSTRR